MVCIYTERWSPSVEPAIYSELAPMAFANEIWYFWGRFAPPKIPSARSEIYKGLENQFCIFTLHTFIRISLKYC